jgi:hypothetical protein
MWKSYFKVIIFSLLTLCPVLPTHAEHGDSYLKLVTALTFNFAKFTDWDNTPTDTLNICFLDDEYAHYVDGFKGKSIQKKTLNVKKINALAEAKQCQILLLSKKDESILKRLFTAIQNEPILTISDQSGFIAQGGMIELYQQDNKIRFDISNTRIKDTGLKISSQVLKLARNVR